LWLFLLQLPFLKMFLVFASGCSCLRLLLLLMLFFLLLLVLLFLLVVVVGCRCWL